MAIYKLETGRSRPKPETLRMIARKTNRPVDFFLPSTTLSTVDADGASALAHLEHNQLLDELMQTLQEGRFDAVIELCVKMLKSETNPGRRAALKLMGARGYIRNARAPEALRFLGDARTYYEGVGDDIEALRCHDVEVACAYVMARPEALAIGLASFPMSSDPQRAYAEWFTLFRRWTKRPLEAHAAAWTACRAIAHGLTASDATTLGRKALRDPVAQVSCYQGVDAQIRAYAEWVGWATHALRIKGEGAHRAARAAMQTINSGGDNHAARMAERAAGVHGPYTAAERVEEAFAKIFCENCMAATTNQSSGSTWTTKRRWLQALW